MHGIEFPIHGIALVNRYSAGRCEGESGEPRPAAHKLIDSGQLYLFVTPAGSRHWGMNYTHGLNAKGKPVQKALSLGSYPIITLVEARL